MSAILGQKRDKAAIARLLADIEAAPDTEETIERLDRCYRDDAARACRVVGLTGPPGVGKSTLVGALIRHWRGGSKTVGVIAVDPSSPRSGGALLGDRTRLQTDSDDTGVFVRSMAARGRLGGLAALTYPAMIALRPLFDIVVVESVGVGQSETDIAGVVDTTVLCVQPGAGDALQFMKAGIAEDPDIVVVNKSDMGAVAERTAAEVKDALGLRPREGAWSVSVVLTLAARNEGVAELARCIDDHRFWLDGENRLDEQRARQADAWLYDSIRDRFGEAGLARHKAEESGETSPFARLAAARKQLAR